MILFDVTLEALPGKEDLLGDLLRRTMAACETETGCLRYRFMRNLDDNRLFHLIELWTDEAALQGHAAGAPFLAFLKALPDCGRVLRSDARSGDLAPYIFVRPAV